jgi:hypothetical protein
MGQWHDTGYKAPPYSCQPSLSLRVYLTRYWRDTTRRRLTLHGSRMIFWIFWGGLRRPGGLCSSPSGPQCPSSEGKRLQRDLTQLHRKVTCLSSYFETTKIFLHKDGKRTSVNFRIGNFFHAFNWHNLNLSDQSRQSSTEVQKEWSFTSTNLCVFMAWYVISTPFIQQRVNRVEIKCRQISWSLDFKLKLQVICCR